MPPRRLRSARSSLYPPMLPVLASIALGGCGGSTPAAEDPSSSSEVAVVDLGQAPAAAPKDANAADAKGKPAEGSEEKEAEGEARAEKDAEGAGEGDEEEPKKYGMIGLLNAGGGVDPNAPQSPWGSLVDPNAPQSAWGSLGGVSGVGGLGLKGAGVGGGGTGGGTLGIGTLGTGSGFGSGTGRLGGSHGTLPKVKMGVTTVTGRLPPEVIRRIVRQNYGRFRLCYEAGLQKDPKLGGKVTVRFVIGKDGAVSNVTNAGSDIPDPGVASCVVRAFQTLSFPQPEGGTVIVVYPIMFSPGSPAPAAAAPATPPSGAKAPAGTAPAAKAPSAKAPPPAPKTQAPQAAPPAPSAPAAPAKQP